MRERGKRRKPGHRKVLYCVFCKMPINHVETRNEDEAKQFRDDFNAGLFTEEAEQSVQYAKQKSSTEKWR